MAKRFQEQNIQSQSKQPMKKRARKTQSSPITNKTHQPATIKTRSKTGRHINYLPNELLVKILNVLETHEQCKFRRVCHRWKDCIEKMFAITRCLKLNLIKTIEDPVLKRQAHKWAPAVSMQSLQFESNWTEPTLELYQKAQVTVQEKHFSAVSATTLGRMFSRVHYLVIYFDFHGNEQNFDNFISLMKCFKMLESFSMIRARSLFDDAFVLKLFDICEQLSPLRRLELFVKYYVQRYMYEDDRHEVKIPMLSCKSLELLEHFALSFWPFDTTQDSQKAILQNIGASLKDARQVIKSRPLEVDSLCIPMNHLWDDLKLERLNMAKVFGSNAELQNVKRLQLTRIDTFDDVKQSLVQLCPKLESLELYLSNPLDTPVKIESNAYVEMINKFDHLTEVKIFNGCLTLFEAGPKAPQIRKLTLADNSLFETFMKMIRDRNMARNDQIQNEDPEDAIQVRMHGAYENKLNQVKFNQIANEFVRLITLKFPSLEQLTVLTDENLERHSNTREGWLFLKDMIINKLNVKSEKLKIINIEMFHVIYKFDNLPRHIIIME